MTLIHAGTTGDELAHLLRFDERFIYGQPSGNDPLVVDTDQGGGTRFVSDLVKAALEEPPSPLIVSTPVAAVARYLSDGNFSHLDFNDRKLLSQPFGSGMAHIRSVGSLCFLFNRTDYLPAVERLILENHENGHRIVFAAALGGGTGSSALLILVPIVTNICRNGGTDRKVEMHVLGILHPAGGHDLLAQRELCNEAAACRETVPLLEGGAYFPNASREGWNQPESFDSKPHLWLAHNPRDRGLDPFGFAATVGFGEYLLFRHPEVSPQFHSEAVNRINSSTEEGPCCNSFGVSRVYLPDQERAFFQQQRFCQEVLEEASTPQGDIQREASAFIREARLAEDGHNRGLSEHLREMAFPDGNPFHGKLDTHAPRGFSVPSRVTRISRDEERTTREMERLLKRLKQYATTAAEALCGEIRDRFVRLLHSRSPATVREIAIAIPGIMEGMSLRLEESISRCQAQAEQIGQRLAQLKNRTQTLSRERVWKRLALEYRSAPGIYQLLTNHRLAHEVDSTIHQIALEVQRSLQDEVNSYVDRLVAFAASLGEAKVYFDSLTTSLSASPASHRGLGSSLEDIQEFETGYLKSGVTEKYGPQVAGQLRAFLAQTLEKDGPIPTRGEIIRMLEEVTSSLFPRRESDLTTALNSYSANEREELLEKAFAESAPLLSIDPIHDVRNQLCFVLIPGGENSPYVRAITEIAARAGCTEGLKFLNWKKNEVVFLRVSFNIPLQYVAPLQRAERALASADKSQQMASFRIPILWFLPPVTTKPTTVELMRSFAMAAIAGLISSVKGAWVYQMKSGSEHELPDLLEPSLEKVFRSHVRRVEAASWFCSETLVRGFSWAFSRLRELGQEEEMKNGTWPKVLIDFQEDFMEVARLHHQEILK